MKQINLKKELGARLFNEFVNLSGLNKVNQLNFYIYPHIFKEYVNSIKNKNKKLYIYMTRNIIENSNFEFIEEIYIERD
jgi:hypothetical protein